MKFAAVVILYYPPENMLANLLTYYSYIDEFFIFDNTESTSNRGKFDGLSKVTYIHDGKNNGISRRLNEGYRMAMAKGFNWVLTMDQDSCFSQTAIPAYKHCVAHYPNNSNVAAFGISYDSSTIESTTVCESTETIFIITSGMLLNVKVAEKIGGFDEDLFIDGVDHEFCMRANLKEYKTIKFGNVFFQHVVGNMVSRASIGSLYLKKKKKHVHTPIRCYYILRNALYLHKKYKDHFPEAISYNDKLVKIHLHQSLWYGGKAWKTFWYIQKARWDFRFKRMGKIKYW